MAATQQVEIKVLRCLYLPGWLVKYGEDIYHAVDLGDRYTFEKEGGGESTVWTGGSTVGASCTCAGYRYRKNCRHLEMANEHLAPLW